MVHYVSFLRLILRLSREGINTFISLEVLSLVSACSLKVSSCSVTEGYVNSSYKATVLSGMQGR
jgi:hypothetical protein